MQNIGALVAVAGVALAGTAVAATSHAMSFEPTGTSILVELCVAGPDDAIVTIRSDQEATWRVNDADARILAPHVSGDWAVKSTDGTDISVGYEYTMSMPIYAPIDGGEGGDFPVPIGYEDVTYWHTMWSDGAENSRVEIDDSRCAGVPAPRATLGEIEVYFTDDCDLVEGSTSWTATKDLQVGPPEGLAVPYGVAGFSIECPESDPGFSVEVSLKLPKPVTELWKYTDAVWFQIDEAEFDGRWVIYNLTDGGELDADGEANGVIVDPVAPAVTANFAG